MLIRVPESWPNPVVATVAMLLLAALDLAGAFAAKEAVDRRSWAWATVGATCFLLLFWVYANSLQWADLGPVTLGWIVLLQVGVVLLDRFHYDTPQPAGVWVAIVVVMAAQGYLVLGRPAATSSPPDHVAVAVLPAPRATTESADPDLRRPAGSSPASPTTPESASVAPRMRQSPRRDR